MVGAVMILGTLAKMAEPPEVRAREAARQEESRYETAARRKAKEYVLASLKSPSTADFPWLNWKVVRAEKAKNPHTYTVYSYVDSQNVFGATVRTNFRIVTAYNGGAVENLNNWEVTVFNHN